MLLGRNLDNHKWVALGISASVWCLDYTLAAAELLGDLELAIDPAAERVHRLDIGHLEGRVCHLGGTSVPGRGCMWEDLQDRRLEVVQESAHWLASYPYPADMKSSKEPNSS